MIIIIGLGNPGKKFEKTRHNLGQMAVKNFAKIFDFPNFREKKKLKTFFSQKKVFGQKIILALPITFMNESGQAVKLLVISYQLSVNNLWLVHDDLDLPCGNLRISYGKSSGGHKGVESIIKVLKTKNFVRFRLGIKPDFKPEAKEFVLKKFSQKEKLLIKEGIKKTAEALEIAIKGGLEKRN